MLRFNEAIKKRVTDEQMQHFIEVAEIINEMIAGKQIYPDNENT